MAQVGTEKWFNAQKVYGFIEPEGGGKDVFIHITALERSGMDNLTEGQKVEFEVASDPKTGKQSASNLKAAS
jgi:CspA family cold shock protein